LRVWTNIPYGRSYLQNAFSFLGLGRFEYVSDKFTTCGINEFNVYNVDSAGSPEEAGHYQSNADVRISEFIIRNNYKDRWAKRVGYTAAHEIGHGLVRHGRNA